MDPHPYFTLQMMLGKYVFQKQNQKTSMNEENKITIDFLKLAS